MMKSLDIKLWRELWDMRMQALAIAMVIVSGVGIFIMSLSTLDSLYETRETYYRDHHFAHIFAHLKRAPQSLVKRIEEIPGVDKVETRVIAYVNLDLVIAARLGQTAFAQVDLVEQATAVIGQ